MDDISLSLQDLRLRCFKCPTKNCKGFIKMEAGGNARCSVCEATLHGTDTIWEKIKEEESQIEKLLRYTDSEPFQLLDKGMRRQMYVRIGEMINPRFLHKNHYLVVRSRATYIIELCLQGRFDRVVSLGNGNLEPLRYQYSIYDYEVLHAYMLLGNESVKLGKHKYSLEMYKQVQNIIRVTHDESNPLQKIVNDRIQQLKSIVACGYN